MLEASAVAHRAECIFQTAVLRMPPSPLGPRHLQLHFPRVRRNANSRRTRTIFPNLINSSSDIWRRRSRNFCNVTSSDSNAIPFRCDIAGLSAEVGRSLYITDCFEKIREANTEMSEYFGGSGHNSCVQTKPHFISSYCTIRVRVVLCVNVLEPELNAPVTVRV